MSKWWMAGLGAAVLVAAGTQMAAAQAAAPAAGETGSEAALKLSAGADLRVREEAFDDVPIKADPPGVTRGGQNNYLRVRSRAWAKADMGASATVYGRVTQEFREYDRPNATQDWDMPEEIVVDNLYLDLRNLLDNRIDLRVGRQDLIYGSGKLVLEGTPKDGSRTIYSDAAKLTWKGLDPASSKTTVDLFGIYNKPENHLVIDSQDRDLTGLAKGYNDMTESGGGVYVKNASLEKMKAEAYYMFKQESEWESPSPTGTGLVDHAELELNTVGFRLMPAFRPDLSGNLEVAYQFGDRGDQDVSGYMVDAVVTYSLPILEGKDPKVGGGMYYLSGDDPDTSDDEGWNPLWARYPQYSELYVYCYDADAPGRWSNVGMPHVDLSATVTTWMKARAMVGYLMAPEDDGPGDGKERGILGMLRTDFDIAKGLLCKSSKRDALTGHLLIEALEPGDYYNSSRETAYFARWELNYAF